MKNTLLVILAVIMMLSSVLGMFAGIVLAVWVSPIYLLLALPYPLAAMAASNIFKRIGW